MVENRAVAADAEIILKIYDLRREAVMRESRDALNKQFWPKSYEDLSTILSNIEHPLNAAYRQVTTYWEMVYSLARYGAVHSELLMESNGEGLFLYAKVLPYIDDLRNNWSPLAFIHTEWVVNNSQIAKIRLAAIQNRIKKMSK